MGAAQLPVRRVRRSEAQPSLSGALPTARLNGVVAVQPAAIRPRTVVLLLRAWAVRALVALVILEALLGWQPALRLSIPATSRFRPGRASAPTRKSRTMHA